MTVQDITTMISSAGFPVVMSLLLLKFMQDQQNRMNEAINELKVAIVELTAELRKRGNDSED